MTFFPSGKLPGQAFYIKEKRNLTGLGELPYPGYLPLGGYAGLSLVTPPIQAGGSEERPSFDQAKYYLQSMHQKSYNRERDQIQGFLLAIGACDMEFYKGSLSLHVTTNEF